MKPKLVTESLEEHRINQIANSLVPTINEEIGPDLYVVYNGVYTEGEIEEDLTEIFYEIHSKEEIDENILDLTSLCIIIDESGKPIEFYWSYDATPQPVGDRFHNQEDIDDMYQALNPYPVDFEYLDLLPENIDRLVEKLDDSEEY